MNYQIARCFFGVTALISLTFAAETKAQLLFDRHETLLVTIEAPLTTLQKARSDEDYLDGKFSYTEVTGGERTFDLKLRARGRYRRQKKTCGFPPVRLNFRTGQVEDSLLEGQDKLKLITHCNNSRSQYEQHVLREYLAYRVLQTLTDKSFSARLLKINYVDTEGKQKPLSKYGFVIEDEDKIAERINMTNLETPSFKYSELNREQVNLLSLYQYMIGNTDFSLIRGPKGDDCCHNVVPYSDGTTITPIPYDFDFSGLVDAPYAGPNPKFKLSSVRSRLYRGRCSNNNILPETIAFFQSKKAEILGLVEELEDLDSRNRSKVTRYLNGFFDEISDTKTVQKKLLRRCS